MVRNAAAMCMIALQSRCAFVWEHPLGCAQ